MYLSPIPFHASHVCCMTVEMLNTMILLLMVTLVHCQSTAGILDDNLGDTTATIPDLTSSMPKLNEERSHTNYTFDPPKLILGLEEEKFAYVFLGIAGIAPIVFIVCVVSIMKCYSCRRRKHLQESYHPTDSGLEMGDSDLPKEQYDELGMSHGHRGTSTRGQRPSTMGIDGPAAYFIDSEIDCLDGALQSPHVTTLQVHDLPYPLLQASSSNPNVYFKRDNFDMSDSRRDSGHQSQSSDNSMVMSERSQQADTSLRSNQELYDSVSDVYAQLSAIPPPSEFADVTNQIVPEIRLEDSGRCNTLTHSINSEERQALEAFERIYESLDMGSLSDEADLAGTRTPKPVPLYTLTTDEGGTPTTDSEFRYEHPLYAKAKQSKIHRTSHSPSRESKSIGDRLKSLTPQMMRSKKSSHSPKSPRRSHMSERDIDAMYFDSQTLNDSPLSVPQRHQSAFVNEGYIQEPEFLP